MVTASSITEAFKPHTDDETNEFLELLRSEGEIHSIEDQSDKGEGKILVDFKTVDSDFSCSADRIHALGWAINGFRGATVDDSITRVWFYQL